MYFRAESNSCSQISFWQIPIITHVAGQIFFLRMTFSNNALQKVKDCVIKTINSLVFGRIHCKSAHFIGPTLRQNPLLSLTFTKCRSSQSKMFLTLLFPNIPLKGLNKTTLESANSTQSLYSIIKKCVHNKKQEAYKKVKFNFLKFKKKQK